MNGVIIRKSDVLDCRIFLQISEQSGEGTARKTGLRDYRADATDVRTNPYMLFSGLTLINLEVKYGTNACPM